MTTTGKPLDGAAGLSKARAASETTIVNWPNAITMSRLVLAFVLFALIYASGYWNVSALLFVIAASTDALDGYIARKYGMITTLGRIMDPFVDKIIVCGTFIFLLDKKVSLDAGLHATSGVNAWIVIIVIGREMFITSLRGFLEQRGQDFSASLSGKLKMATQCVAITLCLLSLSPDFLHWLGTIFGTTQEAATRGFVVFRDLVLWLSVIITIWSGVAYVVRAVQILRAGSKE